VPSGPPPGFRVYGSGMLWYVGSNGYSWSSSIPSGSGNAHFLGFYFDGVGPQNSNYRAYGLPLRCLQEEGGAARHSKTGFCSAKPAGHTYPLVSRRQRKELRAPSSSSLRPGWRRLAHSYGVQIPCLPTNSHAPDSKNYSAQRSQTARPKGVLLAYRTRNILCPRAWGNHSR
jgi:hypothetical protein